MTARDDVDRLDEEANNLWLELLEIFRPISERLVRWLDKQGDDLA